MTITDVVERFERENYPSEGEICYCIVKWLYDVGSTISIKYRLFDNIWNSIQICIWTACYYIVCK
jgi:hypothetical protein